MHSLCECQTLQNAAGSPQAKSQHQAEGGQLDQALVLAGVGDAFGIMAKGASALAKTIAVDQYLFCRIICLRQAGMQLLALPLNL